ncbi:MAG: hypothetical protein HQM16_06655 [Deltaproteobacteria bacterium]|nr:hypothetical protein [Deltaproteobacteria bacterium]
MSQLPMGLIIGLGCALGGLLILTLIILFSSRSNRRAEATWMTTAQKLGLNFTKKVFPTLTGRIDGVDVVANVFVMSNSGPGFGSGKVRPRTYSRVSAKIPSAIPIQVISRRQRYGGKTEWPRHTTGKPDFDSHYEVFAPADVNLNDLLPVTARVALNNTDLPVHIINNAVLWSRVRMIRDPTLLENAILTCTRIAACF